VLKTGCIIFVISFEFVGLHYIVLVLGTMLACLSDIRSKPFSYAFAFVVLMAGMLSLRSGLLLFHQGNLRSKLEGL